MQDDLHNEKENMSEAEQSLIIGLLKFWIVMESLDKDIVRVENAFNQYKKVPNPHIKVDKHLDRPPQSKETRSWLWSGFKRFTGHVWALSALRGKWEIIQRIKKLAFMFEFSAIPFFLQSKGTQATEPFKLLRLDSN